MQSAPPSSGAHSVPSSFRSQGHTEKRPEALPGLRVWHPGRGAMSMPPVSVCHQVSIDRAVAVAYLRMVPHPCFGIDGFSRQCRECAMSLDHIDGDIFALRHQCSDRRRSGVEDGDFMFLHDLPESSGIGVGGNSFKHDDCCMVGQRAVDAIAVAR